MNGESRTSFDLAVVGGGFAGLSAARAASLRGLRVVVLESKLALGAKLHTTGIFVREAADACDIPLRLAQRVTRVRLYGPSRASVDLDAPGYYFLTTDTEQVLRWLGDEARRPGAEIRTACPLEGARREGERWCLRAGGQDLSARYLLGADGSRFKTAAMEIADSEFRSS